MDRRRFIPFHENLEGRTLQATNITSIFGAQVTSNLNIPITYEQKALRIIRLPYYLNQISENGRFLPKAEITQIQNNLYAMLDKINRPPQQALNNYNYQLRHVVSQQSLDATDINRLNYSFGAVLKSANTPKPSIDGMQSALFKLVSQVDTASVLPVTLGTNDYTLTLETALGIGPADAASDRAENQEKPRHSGERQPHQDSTGPPALGRDVSLPHFHSSGHARRRNCRGFAGEEEQQLHGPDRCAPDHRGSRIPDPSGRRRRKCKQAQQTIPDQSRSQKTPLADQSI